MAELDPGPLNSVDGRLDVAIRETQVTLHPDLPPVAAWGYGVAGCFTSPGPVLEARADQPVAIRWRNELPGSVHPEDPQAPPVPLPFATAVLDDPNGDTDSVQNDLGAAGGRPENTSMAPVGWTSVHLHGGHTRADADGWPDNMAATGGFQLAEYDNSADNTDIGLAKVGAHQWYHDHAMNGTRYHVFAGLAGGYLVRDPREAALGLPVNPAQGEIHLLLADRNLDSSEDGLRLLHKTTTDTAEFFGPLTLVNGRVWPRARLRPDVFRFRLLNGSNARAFRLHLVSVDEESSQGAVRDEGGRLLVIGTDGGLLWRASAVGDSQPLVLAPSERLDLLVDLSGLESGRSLHLINSAPAPFQAQPVPAIDTLLAKGDRPGRNPYPWVLRIDIDYDGHAGASGDLIEQITAGELNPGYRRLLHDEPAAPEKDGSARSLVIGDDHDHHIILLAETDPPGHLYLQELVEDPFGAITLQLPGEVVPTTYRVDGWLSGDHSPSGGRVSFYDHIGLRPTLGRWQVWEFVNTTGDTHPIHIHQSQFQPLGLAAGLLTVANDNGPNFYDPTFRRTRLPLLPAAGPGRTFDIHETTGWKDVIRLDPGNVVKVAVRFDTPGRYVYHCHVLEHEDTEMMRPFVVTVLPMSDNIDPAGMSTM